MAATYSPYIIALAWIGAFLMIGTFIRARVKFLQNMLFPSALIGGIIGFIALNLGLVGVPTAQGWQPLKPQVFSVITFHLFAFGFIGIGLLKTKSSGKNTSKVLMRGSLWMCLLFCMLWAAQALVGYGTFSVSNEFFGTDIDAINGYLLGAGFTQGPGQAISYATIWEESHNTRMAVSTGLAFSAVGFLAAGIVGVLLTFFGIKHKWSRNESGATLPKEFLVGIMDKGNHPPCAYTTTHPANIDTLAFHFGLFFAIYGLAYAWALGWGLYLPPPVNSLGIGLSFFWAMCIGMLVRKLMVKGGFEHVLDQETTKRITGFTVDFMFCSVFLGIVVSDIMTMLIPFLVAAALGVVVTLAICVFFGRRTEQYGFERMIALFGLCTGTAASGLLLLRIADPEFESPVAVELGLFNLWAFIIIKPISWSVPFAPFVDYPFVWILAAFVVVTPIVMYVLKLTTRSKSF